MRRGHVFEIVIEGKRMNKSDEVRMIQIALEQIETPLGHRVVSANYVETMKEVPDSD